MKKKYFSGAAVVVCLLSFIMAGCQKDRDVSLRARISNFGNGSKVYLDDKTPRWESGDAVCVNDSIVAVRFSGGSAVLDVSYATDYWAVYPGQIAGSMSNGVINVTVPAVQPYEVSGGNQIIKAPMGAYSDGGDLVFTNLGALLAINITNNTAKTNITIDSVSVSASDIALWGEGQITNYNTDARKYSITSTQTDHNRVVLANVNADGSRASMGITVVKNNFTRVYVYVPSTENANRFTITVHAVSGTEDVSFTRSQQNSHGGSLHRNMMAVVPFDMADEVLPEGVIDGIFSISANQRVRFAQGNLQYQASTNTWRFATNQWDVVGNASYGNVYENGVKCNNALIGADYTGWIDLFGWGANGYINKYPYNSSTNISDYGTPSNNALGNYEWGRNPIQNGGNAGNNTLWFSLNGTQWNYLLSQRRVNGGTGSGYSWTMVTVNGIKGFLLYPDDFVMQGSYNGRADLTAVPAGCVFLPFAGRRDGTSFTDMGDAAYYWARNTSTFTAGNAYYFYTTYTTTPSVPTASYHYGHAVRLVQEVSN